MKRVNAMIHEHFIDRSCSRFLDEPEHQSPVGGPGIAAAVAAFPLFLEAVDEERFLQPMRGVEIADDMVALGVCASQPYVPCRQVGLPISRATLAAVPLLKRKEPLKWSSGSVPRESASGFVRGCSRRGSERERERERERQRERSRTPPSCRR